MNLSLIRSMTRSAVFELENGLCFRPAHPFVVTRAGRGRAPEPDLCHRG